MDNTAQNKNPAAPPAQSSVQKAQEDKLVTGQGQFTPSAPSLNKERMAGGAGGFSESIRPTDEEVKIDEELKKAGVVANSDKPKLDDTHAKIGVKPSLESTPVKTEPSIDISLPMTEEEADETLMNASKNPVKFDLHENIEGEYTEDSRPFLASLIKKIFNKMHKKITGGK